MARRAQPVSESGRERLAGWLKDAILRGEGLPRGVAFHARYAGLWVFPVEGRMASAHGYGASTFRDGVAA